MFHGFDREQKASRWILLPGLLLPVFALVIVFLPGFVIPATFVQFLCMMLGPGVFAVLFGLWWLLKSGVTWGEKLILPMLFLAAGLITAWIADATMPMILYVMGLPTVCLAGVVVLWGAYGLGPPQRLFTVAMGLGLAWSGWGLLRCDGLDGTVIPTFALRWSRTAEQEYLDSLPRVTSYERDDTEVLVAQEGDWPGFRGALRNGCLDDVRLGTNWDSDPPREEWRRAIGPGWSSFAKVQDRLFTQEQRGESEIVLCLDADSGVEVWSHASPGRFTEVIAGSGPRGTPTFAEGELYALGATGILTCLDAASGARVWERNLQDDGQVAVPAWGFASSPLVVDDLVVVFAGGGAGRSVIAYDRLTGEIRWQAGNGTHSYSSPHLFETEETRQILMSSELGVVGLGVADGTILWSHEWLTPGYRVVQPNTVGNAVLIGTNNGMGTRLLEIDLQDGEANAIEKWTSRGMKPYFNDFVIHDDHVYGFDNSILVCLDLETGRRAWKGGRYGAGQLILLKAQGLLLVLTEKTGEVVLVRAEPEKHRELARLKILAGKTWNHPVVSGQLLFVRNSEEAACFKLPPEVAAGS